MNKIDKSDLSLKIGEVYYATLDGKGSVQRGRRPVVVLQNNVGNRHSPNVTVAPLTGAHKKLSQPTHVLINGKRNGLKMNSTVLCENLVTIPQSDLEDYITRLSDTDMNRITEGVLVATGLGGFLNVEHIDLIQKKTAELNK